MKNNCLICSLLFASGIQNAWGTQITDRKANPDQAKPNIILIMCDDMGFSDLSCYGGEVHTPHIDFLGKTGYVSVNLKIRDAVAPAGRLC